MASFILGMFVVFSPERRPTEGWAMMNHEEVVRRNIAWSIKEPRLWGVYSTDNFKRLQKCGEERLECFRTK